jgi:hypothetical protein
VTQREGKVQLGLADSIGDHDNAIVGRVVDSDLVSREFGGCGLAAVN